MFDGFAVQDNGIPVHVQLREHILALLRRGALKPGCQLPTLRQVAVALKVDLNTVQRTYRELERDGILTELRGVGTFVTESAHAVGTAQRQAEDFAARMAAQAKGQGIDLKVLASALVRLASGPS